MVSETAISPYIMGIICATAHAIANDLCKLAKCSYKQCLEVQLLPINAKPLAGRQPTEWLSMVLQ